MQRSIGSRLLSPLVQAVAPWRVAACAAPSHVGFGIGAVRNGGTFAKDDSNDKGDRIDVRFREKSGKQISKHLRKEGRVPAILFRSGDHSGELLSLPLTDIEALLRKYGLAGVGARLLELNFEEGTRKETVIIKQVHQDGVSREVINLTFMPCTPLTKVKLKVPVRTEGEDTCPGIKRGGFAHRVFRSLDVTCLAKDIPPVFMVDISKMEMGDKVFVKDLKIPPGVTVKLKSEKSPILKIGGKSR